MELLTSLIIGVGLSAACGFRIFVPFLGMSIANMSGHLTLSPGFEWIGTWPALIAFATATFFEIIAFYIPWVDNLLDLIATPTAFIAGSIITTTQLGNLSPLMAWSLAAMTGGLIAGILQSGTAVTRITSTGTTGGLGNFFMASLELIMAAITTLLAITFPIVCFVVVLLITGKAIQLIWSFKVKSKKQVA